MAIGTLRCFVIDVEDLEVGAAFWSEVTGIARISSIWPETFAYLGYEDEETWRHEIILHRVRTAKVSDSGAVDAALRLDAAATEPRLTMEPPPRLIISGTANFEHSAIPFKLME